MGTWCFTEQKKNVRPIMEDESYQIQSSEHKFDQRDSYQFLSTTHEGLSQHSQSPFFLTKNDEELKQRKLEMIQEEKNLLASMMKKARGIEKQMKFLDSEGVDDFPQRQKLKNEFKIYIEMIMKHRRNIEVIQRS